MERSQLVLDYGIAISPSLNSEALATLGVPPVQIGGKRSEIVPDSLQTPQTARKIFESTAVPELPYTRDNIKELAREIVSASTTVTVVQAKLSLDIAQAKCD